VILAQARYDRDAWLDWGYVSDNWDDILRSLREHLVLTALAVGIGLLISVPLALLSVTYRRTYPPILSVTGLLYTIPSLALFGLLIPITGLSRLTALIPLVTYTLLILVRNIVEGLDGVPPQVKEAADGMGYTSRARRLRVELPLAVPSIMAGLRIATVTTIGLVTITALIGQDSFGQFILRGLQRDFRSQIMVGVLGSILLAVAGDLLLAGAQRLMTPWARARSAR
jgi:osmoprotectant transport system permease protein